MPTLEMLPAHPVADASTIVGIDAAALLDSIGAMRFSSGPIRRALAACVVLASLGAVVPRASAQTVAGAMSGHLLLADGDLGGGGSVDVWARFDWLRIGGFLGVSSVSSSRDTHNRIAMPIGLSLALVLDTGLVELSLRARGGLWGGATQEVKLTAGGFLGGGPFLMFDLGGGASLGAGVEVWGFFGQGETWAFVPTVSLGWGSAPAIEPVLDGEDDEPIDPALPEREDTGAVVE